MASATDSLLHSRASHARRWSVSPRGSRLWSGQGGTVSRWAGSRTMAASIRLYSRNTVDSAARGDIDREHGHQAGAFGGLVATHGLVHGQLIVIVVCFFGRTSPAGRRSSSGVPAGYATICALGPWRRSRPQIRRCSQNRHARLAATGPWASKPNSDAASPWLVGRLA